MVSSKATSSRSGEKIFILPTMQQVTDYSAGCDMFRARHGNRLAIFCRLSSICSSPLFLIQPRQLPDEPFDVR